MDKEGHQRGDDGQDASPESNVVRLPRDWLGPREELVPFGTRREPPPPDEGSSAGGEQRPGEDTGSSESHDEPTMAAAQDPSGPDDPEALHELPPARPPSAEDFWGEGSAAVQDALQGPPSVDAEQAALDAEQAAPEMEQAAPEVEQAAPEVERPDHTRRQRLGRQPLSRNRRWRRWSERSGSPDESNNPHGSDADGNLARLRHARPALRGSSMALIAAAALACLGLTIRALGGGTAHLHVAHKPSTGGGAGLWRLGIGPSHPGARAGRRRGASVRKARAKRVAKKRSPGAPASAGQAAPVVYAVPSSSSTFSSSGSGSGSTAGSGTGAAGGGSGGSAGSSGGGQSSGAGPTGPGAPFGPGKLG